MTEEPEDCPLPGMEIEEKSPCSSSSVAIHSSKSPQSTCAICHEKGDGYHFGAEACRACAAFFRRSVSLDKKYSCRGDGRCDITANIRCMCRACRFTKCMDVGMNPAGVQQRRDTIGKRDMKCEPVDGTNNLAQLFGSSGHSFPSISNPAALLSDDLPLSCRTHMPILLKMRENYRKMDNARLVIHRKDGQSLFKVNFPKALNYKEAAEQCVREVSLIADWIAWGFDDFTMLPIDQKKVLFRNFYTPFTMLEGAFLCHINNTSTAVLFPSGDYIDIENLEKFFYNPEEEQPISVDEINNMFKPSFELYRRALILPMMADKVDVYEFFALCTLLFWDFGLTGQSDDCVIVGRRVKEQVMKELAFYLRHVKRMDEPAIRVASLLTLLPAVQRSVRRMQEDLEIHHVFNVYAPPEDFYNLVNGKFC